MNKNSDIEFNRRLSIAPMMDWTDRHCRYFLRQITQQSLLYTEMITAQALKHGDVERHLYFREEEQPCALQVGGSDPGLLANAAKLGEEYGYKEINFNIGCPSERVQSGSFGACLMAEPQLVAECVAAMEAVVSVPVTVKTRIGIDDQDSYEFLHKFVDTISNQSKCNVFIIHARKAWLSGLSPKQNREIPPLDYERVYRLKKDFQNLHISINGGITSLDQVEEHLKHVDGVMVGREAYKNPYFLAEADQRIFG
ncbi:MAG: tRNA dihydrouridine(20/20a) synthase DusA, partial [Gammaproteobacteria bacterium]|nr:tRNA dihydrouridine(20/20a) synthase DusA [Gammaproteobacteria bacterium]